MTGGVFFDGLHIPTECADCSFRDVEYGGACELNRKDDYKTFDEQYKDCPIKALCRCYSPTEIPRDATITSYTYSVNVKIERR